MNVFADFQSRVAALIEKRIAAGELPAGSRSRPLRRRAAARLGPRRSLDQRRNGLRREAKAAGSNPRALAQGLVADLKPSRMSQSAEVAGPGFINIVLKPEVY